MIRITFYPLGNADTSLIELENNKKILVDFAHCISGEETTDEKCDLSTELRKQLDANDPAFDIVAFTHSDEDHTRGAADFFEFDFAQKYQGGERVKIKELWVPAAMVLEEGLSGDDQVIRQEARHRLRQGYGIKVFSSPHLLDSWFEKDGINKDSRSSLLIDAGNVVPGLSLATDGAEVFVHSPFAHRDGDSLQSRNEGSLFLQFTFQVDGTTTRVIMGADTTYDVLEDIIRITKYHKREERLQWDLYKLSHHCSYGSLAADKGNDITQPSAEIDWLFNQTKQGFYIISPSWPIPANDDSDQPPHRQAANYYKKKANENGGNFKVTMEHPTVSKPAPMVFVIDSYGPTLKKPLAAGVATVLSKPAPRVG